MSKANGVVEVITKNKANFWNFKLNDGNWYGTGSKDEPSDFKAGDSVEFEYTTKKVGGREYHNVDGDITVTKNTAPSGSGSTSSGPVDWDLKDRKIQYQSARNAAIQLVGILAGADAIVYPGKDKTTPKQRHDTIVALVDGYTEDFYNATIMLGSDPEDSADATVDSDMTGEE